MSDREMKEAIENSAKKSRRTHTNFGAANTPSISQNAEKKRDTKEPREYAKNEDISKNVFN